MKLNIVIGGKAGQGPNTLADILSLGVIAKGYSIFNSREYPSVIRGGHNYNMVSISNSPIASNQEAIDVLVCLDDATEQIHKAKLNKKSLILRGNKTNMFFAGALFKLFELDFAILENRLKQMKNFDNNIKEAKLGYSAEKNKIVLPFIRPNKDSKVISGSEAVASAAISAGLEYYYGYPMTPATQVMTELAQLQKSKDAKHLVIELESEIAVINAALGSSLIGSNTMCGTSGGGFDLMTESLSLSGQAEIPIVIYLAQRPGPSTGLATYTGQADLDMARHSGHGEFPRVLVAPGDPKEAIHTTKEAVYLSQKFRIPAIILSDKHLAESKYTITEELKPMQIEKSIKSLERFNSYEHNSETGAATEDIGIINSNFNKRIKKQEAIAREAQKFVQYKIHGKKESKNIVVGWGSTKGAILDAITSNNLDCKFIQLIYLEPFPEKIKQELEKAGKIFIAENNATSPLSSLIAEKTGILIDNKNKILRYDGRPFFSEDIVNELRKRGVK